MCHEPHSVYAPGQRFLPGDSAKEPQAPEANLTGMEYRFVTHAEVPRLSEQLATLSNLAFAEYEGAPLVDAEFCKWYARRPGSTPEACVGALYGEELVANVLVAIQDVQIGGGLLSCGIVDTVATHPAHRQQGLAHRLMDLAHDLMQQHGAEAGLLYTNPANHPYRFYGRLGYVTRAQAGMLTGARPEATGQWTVRPMRDDEALTVRELVNEHYRGYEGFAPLDYALWDWHRVQRPVSLPCQVVVAERDGQLQGTAALAPVEVLLGGEPQSVAAVSDLVYADEACLQDLLAAAQQPRLMALQGLLNPERAALERLGFATSVGEVSMVKPFGARAEALLGEQAGPWYVMVESVVGV